MQMLFKRECYRSNATRDPLLPTYEALPSPALGPQIYVPYVQCPFPYPMQFRIST